MPSGGSSSLLVITPDSTLHAAETIDSLLAKLQQPVGEHAQPVCSVMPGLGGNANLLRHTQVIQCDPPCTTKPKRLITLANLKSGVGYCKPCHGLHHGSRAYTLELLLQHDFPGGRLLGFAKDPNNRPG